MSKTLVTLAFKERKTVKRKIQEPLIDNITKLLDEFSGVYESYRVGVSFPEEGQSNWHSNMLNLLIQLLEHSVDGFLLSDREGKIFYANKAVEEISGISLKYILQKTAKDLLNDGIILTNSTKIIGKKPLSIIQKIRTGVEVFITSVPIYDESGSIVCYIANYRDMRELNKLLKDIVDETRVENIQDIYLHELKELRNQLLETDEIIVKSTEMKKLLQHVLRVSVVDVNVLLIGQSGVGKEVVTKLIHKHSNRKEGPFIQINCAAIPENLLESELFGYEKGAFTGAQKGKLGILEVANKGTILLDEIGDLPLNLQVKLLRAIEMQQIYRIGGVQPINLDVRIIAATNKNLSDMVEQGTFRGDLFYRLNVVTIQIPSLKERRDDIIPLACYFLKKYNDKYGMNKVFTVDVCNLLEKYNWPGNVRELQNMIEKMVILNCQREITPDFLPVSILHNANLASQNNIYDNLPLKEAKAQLEIDLIKKALSVHKSIRKASKALGVDHSTIVRKAQQYHITLPNKAEV